MGAGVTSWYLDIFKTYKNILIVGIASRTREKAEKLKYQYNIKNVFSDVDELTKKPKQISLFLQFQLIIYIKLQLIY